MEDLRILLVGNGGREHALAWKLSQSPWVQSIWVAPGNGGTAHSLAKVTNIDIGVEDFPRLIAFAKEHDVNLVVPGPEAPLVAGIEDECRAAGLRCFGPSKKAAQMEGSKAFAKAFMTLHGIPTARYGSFKDYESANAFIDSCPFKKLVVKASGLAAGKGVLLCDSKEQAVDAIRAIVLQKEFGVAGDEVVLEEFLEGYELSILSFTDGYTIRSLPPATDAKQVYDDDKGLMTGGMGCFSPNPWVTPTLMDEINSRILKPTIDGMRKSQSPFKGILFTGLMITTDGPKVLEYNVRGGDPETEVTLPLLRTDLAEIMIACTDRWLDGIEIDIDPKFAVTVIAVAGSYPEKYAKGEEIQLSQPPADTMVFHAGTTLSSGTLRTAGGRVIAVTSTGATLSEAIKTAYYGINTVAYKDMHYRKDIGRRALSATGITQRSTTVDVKALTYASAGVSIDAGNSLVQRIKPLVKLTARPGADATIGGFGGVVDLLAAHYTSPPLLVCAIDGVGTKLNIAHAMNIHDTVGIDCVAMNTNDLVVQGAEVLAFLDCYTCGVLDVDVAADFVKGVVAGCLLSGCALVGGETAEMPGLFTGGDPSKADGGVYDAVGAAIGAIKQGQKLLPDKASMRAGDIVLGLKSSGCHSNGFSLIRKVVATAGLSMQDPAPWTNGKMSVGTSLLTPTRIYVKSILAAIHLILGASHITGGGLLENVPRMLPDHLAAEINVSVYQMPGVLRWLKEVGDIEDVEFARTFNTGLGMVLVVKNTDAVEAKRKLEEAGEDVFEVGKLVNRIGEGCVLKGLESWA